MKRTGLGRRVVCTGLIALAASSCGGSSPFDEPIPQETLSAVTQQVETTSHDEISAEHVSGPLDFSTSPSTGGDHYPFWMNCGFYDTEVIEGAATHTMEHGAVWITYNDSVDAAQLDVLRNLAEANLRLLISPYDHAEPIVLSAWGAQLRTVESADAPELRAFIELWQSNSELPEGYASCQGSAGDPPLVVDRLIDGEQVPAEFLG